MRDRLADLTIVDYCDMNEDECYVEASAIHEEVEEAMKNPITSVLIEDDATPGVLLEYHLVNIIDADTNDVLAVISFEQEEETRH